MSSTTRTSLKERSLLKMGALLLAGGLVATACGSDTVDVADADTTTTTVAAMDDDATDELAMADDAMLGAFGPACDAVPTDGDGSFAGMADDPAGTAASNNPLLSTLVTAAGAADLVDTLNSEGPFTIFAPTNDAFAKIDPATLDAVLADKALLTSILTNHVIAGDSLSAEALAEAGTLTTVNGTDLTFDIDGQLMINGVVTSGCQNVPVANGTVHIIDTVLLPEG